MVRYSLSNGWTQKTVQAGQIKCLLIEGAIIA